VLTASQFDALPLPILNLYEEYSQSIINDIARRLAGLDFARPTAAWQVQRLNESGQLYEAILKRLAELTGRSEIELRAMFAKAGVQALKFDDDIYRRAGLSPLPLNLSPAMIDVLKAGLIKTNGLMQNLTRTTAISGQQAFNNAADLAHTQITSGAMGYDQAIKLAIKKVASQGLSVVDFRGRRDQLDVAMRRAVLTGVSQTTGKLQEARADEIGTELVAVSAHAGARNKGVGPMNHESWQGKVYSRKGIHPGYKDFIETTGYGTGEGLCGWNCRHSWGPFYEGISENAYSEAMLDEMNDKTVKYQGKEISQYDASQVQRSYERGVRYWKRQAGALEAAGLDNSQELANVKDYQAKLRGFVKQTGLARQNVREQI
jgi:hypothetical protein